MWTRFVVAAVIASAAVPLGPPPAASALPAGPDGFAAVNSLGQNGTTGGAAGAAGTNDSMHNVAPDVLPSHLDRVDCNHEIETRGSVAEPRTYYAYALHRGAEVPTVVPAGAGVGRI